MTIKQFLNSLYYAQLSIEKKKQKIAELEELATSTGAIRYDREQVISSLPQEASFEKKDIRIQLLRDKLQDDVDELTGMLEKGREILNMIEDPVTKLIMEMRYMNHMEWADIAEEMHYTERAVYYRASDAIKLLKACKIKV